MISGKKHIRMAVIVYIADCYTIAIVVILVGKYVVFFVFGNGIGKIDSRFVRYIFSNIFFSFCSPKNRRQ